MDKTCRIPARRVRVWFQDYIVGVRSPSAASYSVDQPGAERVVRFGDPGHRVNTPPTLTYAGKILFNLTDRIVLGRTV